MKLYHVETREDYDDLMTRLIRKGYTWGWGAGYCNEDIWGKYKKNTVINLNCRYKTLMYSSIDYYKRNYQTEPIIKYNAVDTLDVVTDKVIELQKYREQIAKKKEDLVNHPAHYNQYSQEVIDTIEEVTVNMPVSVAYHVGNAVKYLFRAPFKGKLKQDLEKAVWYLERAVSKL